MTRHGLFGLLTIGCGPTDPVSMCDLPGHICTWAGVPGTHDLGADNVLATESPLGLPADLVFAPDGTAYVADLLNHRIRRVDPHGRVTTLAGTGLIGDGPEGPAADATLNMPTGVALHPSDPDRLTLSAWHNSRIVEIDLTADTLSFVAGDGSRGYSGDGLPALDAALDLPSSVAWTEDGQDLYFSDQANHLLRRLGPDGRVHDVGGTPRTPGHSGDGGPVADALFQGDWNANADPTLRLTIDGDRLLVADTENHVVRVVDLTTSTVLPFAGNGTAGHAGDGGNALAAQLHTPVDVAVGPGGEVYVAEAGNHCVRVVDGGVIAPFAGICGGDGGFAGDGGPAAGALLDTVWGVALDPDGNVYVADSRNHVIRRIAAP